MSGSNTLLSGKVAIVTGASRGVGRGIAHELGIAGATVYVTGRSRAGQPTTDDLPGTIDDAASLVSKAGGIGVPFPCDHANDSNVEELAARVADEHGQLDLLINNVWGGYENYDGKIFELPVSEQPVWRWDRMFTIGVRAHYVTTRALLPLLARSEDPLIVNISFGDDGKFLGDVQYDVAKAAVDRLSFALGAKLLNDGIAVMSVHPGFTRTERVEHGLSEDALKQTHSPRFVGRAVVALAADPNVMARTGRAYKAGQLGVDYGFTDIDGRQPEPFVIPSSDQ